MNHSTRKQFVWPTRVYYEDTDAGGVVYYANYLRFLERARTEWLRATGFEQPDLLRDHQVIFVVHEVSIKYHKPARFNDLLNVTVKIATFSAARFEVEQTVMRDEVLLASARVTIVCVDAQTFRPAKMPVLIFEQLQQDAHESHA